MGIFELPKTDPGWPVCQFVGCDTRQRRHTMSVIWCACALLVTPYKLRMVDKELRDNKLPDWYKRVFKIEVIF